MKLALVVICALAAVATANSVIDTDLIAEVNSNPSASWTAGVNPMFAGMSVKDVKAMLNVQVTKKQPIGMVGPEAAAAMQAEADKLAASSPETYYAEDSYPFCGSLLSPSGIENQEQCGSCWAFSATEVLADQICFQSKGSQQFELSAQDLVSCDTTNMGCNGGILGNAWKWMEQHGVTKWSCLPYTSGNGTTGSCPSTCADGSPIKRFHADNAKHVTSLFGRSAKIVADIAATGVAQAAFTVYQDFMSYQEGIYHHVSGSELGGHAVKIVGYGVANGGTCKAGSMTYPCPKASDGEKFWVVANSWSTAWPASPSPMKGFFLIKRGDGNPSGCNFEGDVWTGQWNGQPAN